MKQEENLQEILEQVKEVDSGVNNLIIPILKDTIKDGNKHNTRLFIFAMAELVVLLITIITSIKLIYKQNVKYQEFLSQFEFETEYTQTVDTDDNSTATVNSGINVDNK